MKYKTFRNLMIVCGFVALIGSCSVCGYLYNRSIPSSPSPRVAEAPPISAKPVTTPVTTSDVDTPTHIPDGLRRIDQKVLEAVRRPVSGDKIKDAFPSEPFKINVYHDAGETGWNRVKVDYNRNEKWDEKWEFVDGKPTKRMVASKDDEQYDEIYRWADGKWVKQ